jgi:hypothetical protein
MERYVAIDNVCAWPNLTMMPDGAIVATIFNQPAHGTCEGDVECWASEDGGRTWKLRGTPAPHEPATNRMNVAAGLGCDGELVVLASGWYREGGFRTRVVPCWACISADEGETWGPPMVLVNCDDASDGGYPSSVQLADGTVVTAYYANRVAQHRRYHMGVVLWKLEEMTK